MIRISEINIMKGFLNHIIISILLLNSHIYRHDIPFNSYTWRNWIETEVRINSRWDMRNDLILNYNLTGMTPSEIIDLLGEPSNNSALNLEYTYFLGMARFGIDTGSLILKFKNGKVSEAKVFRG